MNLYRINEDAGHAIHIVAAPSEQDAIRIAEADTGADPGRTFEAKVFTPDELVTIREEYGGGDWVATERTAAEWAADGEGFIASTEW